MAFANKGSNMAKRNNERRPYSGHIFFVAKDGFNEGRLKDYNKSGLFIITKIHLRYTFLERQTDKVQGTYSSAGQRRVRNRAVQESQRSKSEDHKIGKRTCHFD